MSLKTEVCRLCLKKDEIFALVTANSQSDLKKLVNYCLNIKMYDSDGCTLICTECLDNLRKFYDFRKKCRVVHKQLSKINQIELYEHQKILNDSCSNNYDKCEDGAKQEFDNILNEMNLPVNEKSEKFKNNENEKNMYEDSQNVCNFSAESIRFKTARNSKDDLETIPHAKPVQCELCGKIYKDQRTLKKHLTETHGDKQYSCKICNKKFTRAEHKVVHMRAHSGIRPFICEVCARGFTKKQDLLRHMLIHSEEKKFCCPRCDRRFKRSGDVRSHMRSHTGHKPYSCVTCRRSYSSHSGLKKHLKTHFTESTAPGQCAMDGQIA